ncbi:hypothetical protein A1O3_06116 [Capronia epimyces CBS 606.96]|uniref:Uncharacterized protein n=1 Tax=Capronia epimyces CBS 606.96 TaxID=1182542 RepID=W9XQ02_9EURO|nr:uncharacterized protein A1O3_06116 [Capronia epimyces CBS 606.96]EXJ82303.1 hypothetical protein A1O3_06116 [Capronia epimyces CBS 606.96]
MERDNFPRQLPVHVGLGGLTNVHDNSYEIERMGLAFQRNIKSLAREIFSQSTISKSTMYRRKRSRALFERAFVTLEPTVLCYLMSKRGNHALDLVHMSRWQEYNTRFRELLATYPRLREIGHKIFKQYKQDIDRVLAKAEAPREAEPLPMPSGPPYVGGMGGVSELLNTSNSHTGAGGPGNSTTPSDATLSTSSSEFVRGGSWTSTNPSETFDLRYQYPSSSPNSTYSHLTDYQHVGYAQPAPNQYMPQASVIHPQTDMASLDYNSRMLEQYAPFNQHDNSRMLEQYAPLPFNQHDTVHQHYLANQRQWIPQNALTATPTMQPFHMQCSGEKAIMILSRLITNTFLESGSGGPSDPTFTKWHFYNHNMKLGTLEFGN